MISKIGNIAMDFAIGAKIVKELLLRLLTQYHEKSCKVEFIFFQKLVYLKPSNYKNTRDYIGKLCGMSQRLEFAQTGSWYISWSMD